MTLTNSKGTELSRVRSSASRALGQVFGRDRSGLIGAVFLGTLIIVAVLAPWVAPHDPAAQSISTRLVPPMWSDGGSSAHVLGTDNLGRDVLSRIIYGARVTLIVGFLVVVVAGGFGTLVGLLAGYCGGRTNAFLMRVVDIQMAFPGLLMALVILAAIGPSLTTIVIVLAFNNWMIYARVTHGIVLSLREEAYIEAAQLIGCKSRRILFKHMLPNLSSPLLTLATLEFAAIVLSEAALSFLGVGIQPPQTSWGLDVSIGKDYIFSAWWLVTFPGVAIALTVLAVNLIASWLRVQLDPAEKEKSFAARRLKSYSRSTKEKS